MYLHNLLSSLPAYLNRNPSPLIQHNLLPTIGSLNKVDNIVDSIVDNIDESVVDNLEGNIVGYKVDNILEKYI